MSNEIEKRKENIVKALGLKFYEPFTVNDKKYILRITEDFFVEEFHKVGETECWGRSLFSFREIINTKITPIVEYTDVEKTIIKCAYLAGYKYVAYAGKYNFVFCKDKDMRIYKNEDNTDTFPVGSYVIKYPRPIICRNADPYIIMEFPNVNLEYDIPHLKLGAVKVVDICKGEKPNEINR